MSLMIIDTCISDQADDLNLAISRGDVMSLAMTFLRSKLREVLGGDILKKDEQISSITRQ
jgi:hypothetical protein